MIKQLNPFNLRLVWRGWSTALRHGYHPQKEGAIYEYWQVGPVELQSFFRQDQLVEYLDLDLMRSNGKQVCAWCGTPITPENDSEWEAFVENNLTQPTCKVCDEKARNGEFGGMQWLEPE